MEEGWKKKRGRMSRGIYLEGKKAGEVGEKKKVKGRQEKGGRERTGKEGYMDRSTCVQM